jgi:uncharacterized membrane protein YqjE
VVENGAYSSPAPRDEASPSGAVERAVDATQRIVVDRMELLRLEAQQALTRLLQDTGLLALGGVLALVGWCALMGWGVVLLRERVSLPAGLASIAVLNAVLATVLVGFAVRRMQRRDGT